MLISCIAFVATTMPPRLNFYPVYVNINKEYTFGFSKRELISRLNMIELKEVDRLNKLSGGVVNFNSESDIFYYSGTYDTLAFLLDVEKIKDMDSIPVTTFTGDILIAGNATTSKIKLLTLNNTRAVSKDKALRLFEKKVIKKIKNYR
jgi:hypothetical protein